MSPDPAELAARLDAGSLAGDPAPEPHVALQRVCVRLLFDPDFVQRVYGDPEGALAGLGIPPALRDQLVTNDRRLWQADGLRRRRALKVLMEEFKVSTTLVLAERGQLAALDAFFSSESFHRTVQRRGYLALAFASWLEAGLAADGSEALRAVLALEAGMARCRREQREWRRCGDPIDARGLTTAPGVGSVLLPAGVLALVQHVERYLFEVGLIPALALCSDAPRPDPLPPLDPAMSEAWLLECGAEGRVELSGITERYHRVVSACAAPRQQRAVIHGLESAGIDEAASEGMIAALLEAGVLRVL